MGRTKTAIDRRVEHLDQPQGQIVKEEVKLEAPSFGYLPIDLINGGEWITFGLVGDTHLACKECRLDSLHAQYDLFEQEGITTVLHAGNIVDGYVPRINGDSALCTSIMCPLMSPAA